MQPSKLMIWDLIEVVSSFFELMKSFMIEVGSILNVYSMLAMSFASVKPIGELTSTSMISQISLLSW